MKKDTIYTIVDPRGKAFRYKKIDHPKYKYEMVEDYTVYLKHINHPGIILKGLIELYPGGRLVIKKGFMWDGASGPTIDTVNTMRASCVHDVFYKLIRLNQLTKETYKPLADKEFRLIMEQDWIPKTVFGRIWEPIRSGYFYWGVKLFGGWSCIPGSDLK